MSEMHLKQLIKSIREKRILIVFLLGFLSVTFFAFSLLMLTLFRSKPSGQITDQAVSTQASSSITDSISESDNIDKNNGIVIYFVHEGDSSWKVAEDLLGSGNRYHEIEKLNGLKHNQLLDIGQMIFVDTSEKIVVDTGEKIVAENSSYIVEKGDSLWNIALENYSNPAMWQEIYELNKQTIGSNPNLIYPSTRIFLPDL